jgi:hypothetical protein
MLATLVMLPIAHTGNNPPVPEEEATVGVLSNR